MSFFETTSDAKKAAKFLKAISNTYRLLIVEALTTGEKSVSALNEKVNISQPSLSQHLKILKSEHIIISRRDARNIYYSISNPKVLRTIGSVVETKA